jgi:hypothetical protein
MHRLLIAALLLISVWAQDAPPSEKLTGFDFDVGTFVYAHYYPEHYLEKFGVWPIDDYYIEPTLRDRFEFPADAMDQIPADNEYLSIFKENGDFYGDFVRRFKSPPHGRFFSLGEDNVTRSVGDGYVNETSLREETTYVSFVNDDMDFGLFAARDIAAGEPIGIYTGIVRNFTLNTDYSWEYNRFAVVKGKDGEPLDLYIDALQAGNHLRFSNHALNADDINVEQRYIPVDGVWYVLYVTMVDIHIHDQLWVSYGEDYWTARKKKEGE